VLVRHSPGRVPKEDALDATVDDQAAADRQSALLVLEVVVVVTGRLGGETTAVELVGRDGG
jgi:hypothetical protein